MLRALLAASMLAIVLLPGASAEAESPCHGPNVKEVVDCLVSEAGDVKGTHYECEPCPPPYQGQYCTRYVLGIPVGPEPGTGCSPPSGPVGSIRLAGLVG